MMNKDLPSDVVGMFRVSGFSLNARMQEMGVTGMIEKQDGWYATFAGSEVSWLLPPPVSQYLLMERP